MLIRTASSLSFTLALLLLMSFAKHSPVDLLLSTASWGAGSVDLSSVNALVVTGRHTERLDPNPVRQRIDGSIEKVVRLDLGDLVPGGRALPQRSVAYEYFIAAVVLAHSAFGNELVYDFGHIVELQYLLTFLALLTLQAVLTAIVLSAASPGARWENLLRVLSPLLCAYLFILLEPRFTNGLIDSSLAPALIIFATAAWALGVYRRSKRWLMAAFSLLSLTLLVRGETLFPALLLAAITACWLCLRGKRRLAAVLPLLTLSLPLANGLFNLAIHDAFVPLRMQSGQNLYQPIGQCDNPWGIQYSDAWFSGHMAETYGLDYLSFQTDRVASGRYRELISEQPSFFVTCWWERLVKLNAGILRHHYWPSLLSCAALLGWFAYRYRPPPHAVLALSAPLLIAALAVVSLTFFNRLPRIYEPYVLLIRSAKPLAGLLVGLLLIDAISRLRWRLLADRTVGRQEPDGATGRHQASQAVNAERCG